MSTTTTGSSNSKSRVNNSTSKVLTLDSINPLVKQTEYAVRGEMAVRAEEIRQQLSSKAHSFPFQSIVNCNIGNPQQLDQTPITWIRQVSALLDYPALMDKCNESITLQLFAKDAIDRARTLQQYIGSSGAYSHSQGIPAIRESVARFIEKRDNYPSNADHIFLTAGASPGVQSLLQVIIAHEKVGIMIPIPQYPLYSAAIALCNGRQVPYYLDEDNGWALSGTELLRAISSARKEGTQVRALCVINPGNPTGNVLRLEDMQQVIQICRDEHLVLMADEVYQANVYYPKEHPWHSFKKVLFDMGPEYSDHVELVSFHSISKGLIGECGRRGAYFECVNIDANVRAQLYKLASISLCPNVQGQIAVDLMVNPPVKGDDSYDTYMVETSFIYESLKRRAQKLTDAFNSLQGVSCQRADGAMYLFPRIKLPRRAIEEANRAGKAPDLFYTRALLDATGVCLVPGSGFLQAPDTYHFRCTFLPPEHKLDGFIGDIQTFHKQFLEQYS